MKNKLNIKASIVFVISVVIIVSALIYNTKIQETRALFSWKSEEVVEGRAELFKTMKNIKLNQLYQHFSKSLKSEEIESFLIDARNKNIEVSLLAGESKWALDKDGNSLIYNIERVIEINNSLGGKGKIKSIIFDVEPYLLKEWNKENNDKIMDSFLSGMKAAYKRAKEENLEMIVSIPYYYDDMGFSKQLEDLIKNANDSVAIMNYFKEKETEHIKQEVEWADKYRKKVINIYELQQPGQYGLEDKNTYYKEGIEAVEKSFNNIEKEFYGKNVLIAFHVYRAVKEILERK